MADCQKLLEDHYADPYHRGACEHPTHSGVGQADSGRDANGKCQLELQLAIDAAGQIREAWFDGVGCQCCEGMASVLVERLEGTQAVESELTVANLSGELSLPEEGEAHATCLHLPFSILQIALQSPLDQLDDDLADGTRFGGPSLREEC